MLGGSGLKAPLFLRLALAGGCLLLVAAAASCGGSDKGAPSPTAESSPVPTVEPLPTIDPNVPLAEFHSDLGYSVGYPEGWDVRATPSSQLAGFTWSQTGVPIAQLTLFCNQGANQTIEGLMGQDAGVIARNGGIIPQQSTPVEVGGVPGKQVTYTTSLGGLPIEQVAVYVVKGDCGWRIALATYESVGSLQAYLPLFDRIIASIRFD